MKITELKCSACNGPLKIDELDPKIAVCEYCKSRYIIEDYEAANHTKPASPDTWYVPKGPEPPRTFKKTGWEAYGWKRVTALSIGGILILLAFNWKGISRRMEIDKALKSDVKASVSEGRDDTPAENDAQVLPFEGVFAVMAEDVLEKPADAVTADDLSRFQWLELQYKSGVYQVGYSFQNPYEDENAALTWLVIPKDNLNEQFEQLSRFTGLKKLKIDNYLSAEYLKGLNLIGLGCNNGSPGELSTLVENPAELKEMSLSYGLKSLEGLENFPGLERLTIDGPENAELKELVHLKSLKSLTLEDCDEISDFSVLSVMPWLEELSVDSEGIRDIGFVAGMPALKTLSLTDAMVLNLNSLEGNTSLTSLTIDSCDEMKDCSSIAGLTGLEQLSLDLPYGCAEPDLSGLTQMRDLTLGSFESTAFLGSMTGLERLRLERCGVDRPSAFSALSNLTYLKCFAIYGDLTDWSFVKSLSALETLDITGMATFEDISGLFGMPALHTLLLSGVECEIDFSKLQPNPSLRTLQMDVVKLYKNVKVDRNGGITYVDYDPVALDEHTEFLTNYQGLEHLSLMENKLTHINFTSTLTALKTLDINNNYVTDLKPLEAAAALETVNCIGNPITNYMVLGDEVTIIK